MAESVRWLLVASAACAAMWYLSSQGKKRKLRRGIQKNLVGVVGGLGPKATAVWYDDNILRGRVKLFQAMQDAVEKGAPMVPLVSKVCSADWTEEELQQVWQRRIGHDKLRDQDHIALLIFSNPTIPGRPEFMSGQSSLDPTQAMADTAQALVDAGASALCMVCSTAHYFKQGMLRGISVPFLDMIELTFQCILRQVDSETVQGGKVKVGLLGTEPMLKFRVYERVCEEQFSQPGALEMELLTPFTVDGGDQNNFTESIFGKYGVKAGYDSDLTCPHTFRNFELLLKEVVKLWKSGAQAIILGCTELPLLLTEESIKKHGPAGLDKVLFVNPAQVLADEVIRFSLLDREHPGN